MDSWWYTLSYFRVLTASSIRDSSFNPSVKLFNFLFRSEDILGIMRGFMAISYLPYIYFGQNEKIYNNLLKF